MKQAAFRACYADWKLVKTRSTVQIVLEVPVEQAGLAYEVLGGMPTPGSEIWCGVARLDPTKESAAQPRPSPTTAPTSTGGAHTKMHWNDMGAAQQAGVLCNEPAFRRFLAEHMKYEGIAVLDINMAAEAVRNFCGVTSRSLIDKFETAQAKWRDLVISYRAWKVEVAVVA